jgi:hypothetical protein
MRASATEEAIIGKCLDDVLRRLEAAPQTPDVQQLAGRALAFRRRVATWADGRPLGDETSKVLQQVLAMHIEVIQAGIWPDEDSEPSLEDTAEDAPYASTMTAAAENESSRR